MRKSLKSSHYHDIAAALLYLACKLNDVHIRLKDFILYHHRKHHKNESLLLTEADYIKWKNTLIYLEEYALVTLCFDMETENPFTFFLEIRQKIKDSHPGNFVSKIETPIDLSKHFPIIAWSFLYDIQRSTLIIQYPMNVIVVGCWYLASRMISHPNAHFIRSVACTFLDKFDPKMIQGRIVSKLILDIEDAIMQFYMSTLV